MNAKSIKQQYEFFRENNYLPGPKVMQIEITNRCRLHCPQCYKPPVKELKSMDIEVFKKHIDEAASMGVTQLNLLGGEPFENPSIIEMIEYAISKNMEVMTVTSGYCITPKYVSLLQRINNKFTLLISLNGSTEEINCHSRDGYKVSINAAKRLHEAGILYGINWVARHDNVYDFENLVSLARRLGASFVNVVVNKLTGNNDVDSPLTAEDYEILSSYIKRENESHYISIQKCYDLLITRATKLQRTPLSGCQAGISVAAITLNGFYAPCLHLMYPEAYMSLKEYWEKSPVLKRLREKDKVNGGHCAGCIHASDCKYCRAMSKGSHDDFNNGLENCVVKEY